MFLWLFVYFYAFLESYLSFSSFLSFVSHFRGFFLVFDFLASFFCSLACFSVFYEFFFLLLARTSNNVTLFTWTPVQRTIPDVPHAVNVFTVNTEGSGVGFTKEPPVTSEANIVELAVRRKKKTKMNSFHVVFHFRVMI